MVGVIPLLACLPAAPPPRTPHAHPPIPGNPYPLHNLQDLWPNSFAGLVRVYNHKAVDCLLVHHDEEATKRDRLVAAVAAARAQAKAQGCEGGADSKAGEPDAGRAAAEGGKKWWHCGAWRRTAAAAAARLAAAEARLAAQEQNVVQLEAEIEGARQAALKQPLGSAFIALFRCETGGVH